MASGIIRPPEIQPVRRRIQPKPRPVARFERSLHIIGRPFPLPNQRQAHGPSVQEAIEAAARKITGETVAVHAAGRTDAGVHATGMRAHLDIERPITPFRLMWRLTQW